ncbi:MAG: NAD(P)-binding domain-containing protein, partial [Thermoproteota archaeon]|nr:NAD(P)-binding domain-containing protein [Thermoproteota archaeon]
MNIGILGSGDVGRRLGDGLITFGHKVKIGTREPGKLDLQRWINNHGQEKAAAGTFAEATSFGDELIFLATLWDGASNAIKMANIKNFTGKIVIDVTNPLDFSKGMPPRLAVGHTDSAGETVQRLLPESKIVKALNTVGNLQMVNPDFQGGPPTMFVCGNDKDAKKTVADSILTPFGWETIDIGGIEGSR